MLVKYKKILFTCLVLFSYVTYADSKQEHWYTNYKNPSYFVKTNDKLSLENQIISPDDSRISGYIFEISNHDPSTSMEYITIGLNEYLTKQHIQTRKVIHAPRSYIFFMPKNKNDNQRLFYKQFAQVISWLLFNRRDTVVAIRPIMAKENRTMFNASQVIYLDPPKVHVGHNDDAFVDPEKTIVDGFHIHMDYLKNQQNQALQLFQQFKTEAAKKHIIYSDLDTYPEYSNGPHVRAGWEVKFERKGSSSLDQYGYALAWLMLNHQEVPIYSHSKSWRFGENEKRLISHLDNALYSGIKPEVNQWFFYDPENNNSGLYRWDSQLEV